ncbi:MAG: DUF4349 domain-containing protein [Clostridia bacterium]|nr:DUF4349 domain-containing protein [Deltaproteobacteria bacterium]
MSREAPGRYESSTSGSLPPFPAEAMPKGASGGEGSMSGGGLEREESYRAVDNRSESALKKSTLGDKPKQDEAPAKRMVHYDGWVRVRVTDPRKTLDAAAQLAIAAGGYVERQDNTMVMLRVPVAKVRDAFTELQKLGDVLSRSLTAQDVTDSFTAAELRLKTLRASRDRLIALLATVKDENERLQILSEIRRLTETIDSLDLQMRTLASLAAYSRLTLETVPREQRGTSRSDALAAFQWMDALSPFSRSVAANEKKLKLETPKEFVLLSDVDRWIAESADGAAIWTHERKNAPVGSSDFWASALAGRLGNDFSEVKREQVGDYAFVTFIDGGDTHYRYRVGVKADGKTLDVIEIYYPTPDHEARYGTSVNAAINGGAS